MWYCRNVGDMLQALTPVLQAGGAEIFLLVFFLVAVVGFVIWLGISYWVYKDASKRNMDSPILWAAVTFFIGIFGVVIYVLVRE